MFFYLPEVHWIMKKKKKTIACLGDSITAGIPGVSFLPYIKSGVCLNYGRGGDTLKGALRRAGCMKPSDRVIIEIGTNDILIPFLLDRSPFWKNTARRLIRRGSVPARNPAEFQALFQKLLEILEPGKAAVVSIPCIGEDLESGLNYQALEYNHIISSVCEVLEIPFIDINILQRKCIREAETSPHYLFEGAMFRLVTDGILVKAGMSMSLSCARGLRTTIDGVHFNSSFAEKTAVCIEDSFNAQGRLI